LELSTERYGNRTALAMIGDPQSTITYGRMRQMVDSIATYLMDQGIEKGDRVAILAESQPLWGVAFFAIISCGAVAVPILPDFSSKEIGTILEHSGAKGVVVSSKLFEKCQAYVSDSSHLIFRLDDLFHIPSAIASALSTAKDFINAPGRDTVRTKADSSRIAARESGEEDLASIIYTSGTTGPPKGAMLAHEGYLWVGKQATAVSKGTRDDETISFLPLNHVYEQIYDLMVHLTIGHIINFTENTDTVMADMRDVSPTLFHAVPRISRISIRPCRLQPRTVAPGARGFSKLNP